jgi:hypothetical protein
MSTVVTVVNYIRNNGLNFSQWIVLQSLKHRTFRAFLQEVEAEYGDQIYHTEVRWLGRRAVLQRFVDIRSEVINFLEGDRKTFTKLQHEACNCDVFFLCDITSHLSQLNKQFQGMSQLVFDTLNAVK